jgi:hypothetical protein
MSLGLIPIEDIYIELYTLMSFFLKDIGLIDLLDWQLR